MQSISEDAVHTIISAPEYEWVNCKDSPPNPGDRIRLALPKTSHHHREGVFVKVNEGYGNYDAVVNIDSFGIDKSYVRYHEIEKRVLARNLTGRFEVGDEVIYEGSNAACQGKVGVIEKVRGTRGPDSLHPLYDVLFTDGTRQYAVIAKNLRRSVTPKPEEEPFKKGDRVKYIGSHTRRTGKRATVMVDPTTGTKVVDVGIRFDDDPPGTSFYYANVNNLEKLEDESFKVGDRVRYVYYGSTFYGRIGTITELQGSHLRVRLDGDMVHYLTGRKEEFVKVEESKPEDFEVGDRFIWHDAGNSMNAPSEYEGQEAVIAGEYPNRHDRFDIEFEDGYFASYQPWNKNWIKVTK